MCHVVTATKVLIFVFIFFWALVITSRLPVSLTYGIFLTLVAVCTIFALKHERHGLLWPFIIYSAIFFALTLVTSVVFICLAFAFGQDIFDFFETEAIVGNATAAPPTHERAMSGSSFFFLAAFFETVVIICTVFCYWQMIVVYRCKEYFEEKHLANMPIVVDDPQSISSAALQYALANGYDQPPPVYSDAPQPTAMDEQHKY
uniref:Uncharacterized protein n=1 Tax=Plectus sambesii TaxID=2011161 RepID=A0A914VUQ0_9BILA